MTSATGHACRGDSLAAVPQPNLVEFVSTAGLMERRIVCASARTACSDSRTSVRQAAGSAYSSGRWSWLLSQMQ